MCVYIYNLYIDIHMSVYICNCVWQTLELKSASGGRCRCAEARGTDLVGAGMGTGDILVTFHRKTIGKW